MTDEKPSLPELAKKIWPAQAEVETASTARRSLTVDEAYGRLQEKKDQVADERALQEAEPAKPKPVHRPAEEPPSDALWSNEDIEFIGVFKEEAARFQQDLAAFAQVKDGLDLNALEKQDRARAVAMRTQLSAAESELRERYDTLQAAAGGLARKATAHNRKRVERFLNTQLEKLNEALPGLDRDALRMYLLTDAGFQKHEINVCDYRLVVLAEKARKWDEHMAARRKNLPPIPKAGGKKKPPPVDSEYAAAKQRTHEGHLTRTDATTLLRAPRDSGRNTLTKREAKRRLRESGSINDAYAFLEASRRAAR